MEMTSHPAGTSCFPEPNTRHLPGSKAFHEIPEIGRFAILADTSDIPFGVIQAPSRS